MKNKIDFEYIVIGSGPAGSAVALTLAKAKKKVAIIESSGFGGTNLNSRDVPYRAALNFSDLYAKIQAGGKFGLTGMNMPFNYPSLAAWQEKTIARVGGNDRAEFEAAGITCIEGYANLLDKNTVAVGSKQYSAARIILATGSTINTAGIAGADTVSYLTPETALRTRRLPRAVAIVGGGASGCEIATYFSELGVKVLLLEMSDRILPREDKDVSDAIATRFDELRTMVLTNSRVTALEQDNLSKRVIFVNDGRERMVRVDTIVLATGYRPTLDYGLENADIKYKKSGVLVDSNFNTTAKNIWAVGDIVGGESSTERASYQGMFLANHLISRAKALQNYNGFVRVVKTHPEVAVVGLNEDDLLKRDKKARKAVVALSTVTAGKIEDNNIGFVKILADKNDKIIGATIVAPNAELMISELAMAVRFRLSMLELASVPHSMNSYNIAIRQAARQLVRKKK